jgi:hypothetical protein
MSFAYRSKNLVSWVIKIEQIPRSGEEKVENSYEVYHVSSSHVLSPQKFAQLIILITQQVRVLPHSSWNLIINNSQQSCGAFNFTFMRNHMIHMYTQPSSLHPLSRSFFCKLNERKTNLNLFVVQKYVQSRLHSFPSFRRWYVSAHEKLNWN